MSEEIQRLVDENQVDQVLQHLDYGAEDEISTLSGPFMVFRALGAAPDEPPGMPDGTPDGTPDHLSLTPCGIQDILNPSCSLLITEPDPSSLDLLDDVLADVDNDKDLSLDLSYNTNTDVSVSFGLHMPQHGFGADDFQTSISTHAHFLLEHYKSQMGKLFSPLRARKSPWSILHFPRALSALAELSVFKTTKHAHTSLLYSVLAVSAFNWDNIHRDQRDGTTYWRHVGEGFLRGAKRELEWTCETELAGEKSSKYKDILMAILTMVTISVVTGQQEEARSYLLNAEMFIGFRGTAKTNKSKKVKLLHSIYLFLRVIEESTYIYPPEKQQQRIAPLASPSLPLDGMRFPSLRTHSLYLGRDLDAHIGMDFEFGLFGEPDNSGYFKDIYGFPQELISFISRATFLANEMAALRTRYPELSITSDLEHGCTQLEADICAWTDQSSSSSSSGSSTVEGLDDPISAFANRAIMAHLIAAFHCATIIFFYRRVRGLHALILQPWVDKTLAHLHEFEHEQRRFSLINCGIVWPGFVAGAEALSPDLQAGFHTHLRSCAALSGMRNFDLAADTLQTLWRAREETGRGDMTWMDLVRDRQLSLVLT